MAVRAKKKPIKPARRKRWVRPAPASIILSESFAAAQLPILGSAASKLFDDGYRDARRDTDDFSSEAMFDIRMYRERALKGEQAAADELHKIAENAVRALNWVADEKPELLRALASKKTTWPVLFSHSPIVQASLDKRLQTIGFATKLGTNLLHPLEVAKSLSATTSKGAKGWALRLINAIQVVRIVHANAMESVEEQMPDFQSIFGVADSFRDELYDFNLRRGLGLFRAGGVHVWERYTSDLLKDCARLPDFSPEPAVVDAWWNVGYDLLMLNTNGQPEWVPAFMVLGLSRAKHYSGLKSDPNPKAELKSLLKATAEVDQYKLGAVMANIRSKILTDLQEEFGRLARQLAKAGANSGVFGGNHSK